VSQNATRTRSVVLALPSPQWAMEITTAVVTFHAVDDDEQIGEKIKLSSLRASEAAERDRMYRWM
jgi:hypothetical protein